MAKILFTFLLVLVSNVYLLAQTVQAGISLNGTNLVITAKPNGAISGNLSGGNITIVWPTSYGITLGAITSSIGTWSVQSTGPSGANTYSNIGLISLATPIDWANASVNELFRVPVNQTGSGTGTFSLMNNIPDGRGNWYFEVGGSDLTNNVIPFYAGSVSNVPLPVELSSFTAAIFGNSINLNWITATEVNNYGFEIQRRIDQHLKMKGTFETSSAEDWIVLGFVQGNGYSNSPKEYSFTDNSSVKGTYSYRLKMIDNDGTYKYSDIIKVEVNPTPIGFFADQNYPNPFNPVTTVKYGLAEESIVTIDLYNSIGEKVKTLLQQKLNAGVHFQNVVCDRLANGIYILNIRAEGSTQIQNKSIKMILLK